jgi:hypothetical protein
MDETPGGETDCLTVDRRSGSVHLTAEVGVPGSEEPPAGPLAFTALPGVMNKTTEPPSGAQTYQVALNAPNASSKAKAPPHAAEVGMSGIRSQPSELIFAMDASAAFSSDESFDMSSRCHSYSDTIATKSVLKKLVTGMGMTWK